MDLTFQADEVPEVITIVKSSDYAFKEVPYKFMMKKKHHFLKNSKTESKSNLNDSSTDMLNDIDIIPLNSIFPISFKGAFKKKFSIEKDLDANTDYIINFSYLQNNFSTSKITIFQGSSTIFIDEIDFTKSYVKFTTDTKGKYDITFDLFSVEKEIMNDLEIFIIKSIPETPQLPIPISKTIVYSVDSIVNTTFSFITDKKFNYNNATINIKSLVGDINLSIKPNSYKDPISLKVGLDVTPVYIATTTIQEEYFSFAITVFSPPPSTDKTLRLIITIDSLYDLHEFSLDQKDTYSDEITYGYMKINEENKSKDGFIILNNEVDLYVSKILLTNSDTINSGSFVGNNQGIIIENTGFSFNTGNHKYVLFEIHNKPLKTSNTIEISLIDTNFKGHPEVTTIKCTTTKPKIFEISDPDLINQYVYLYSTIGTQVKAILSVDAPIYNIDAKDVNSVESKNGIISPIEPDLAKYLKKIYKLYISLFSTNTTSNESEVQLYFGTDSPLFLPINAADANFELNIDIKANQTKLVIIKSDTILTNNQFRLSSKEDILLAYKQFDKNDLKNVYSPDLTDISPDSAFHEITFTKEFIVVRLKSSSKDYIGKLYFTKYEKKTESFNEDYDQNTKYFYSIEPTSNNTISIKFSIKSHENSFKLYIDSRSGVGQFINAGKQIPIEDMKTTTQIYENSTTDIEFEIRASSKLIVSIYSKKEISIDDIHTIKNYNTYTFYEKNNSLVYILSKSNRNFKAKRLFLHSNSSIITNLSYSMVKIDDLDNNKIYDNQDIFKKFDTNSNSYVINFEMNDVNSYSIIIKYELSSGSDTALPTDSSLSILAENNKFYLL